MCNPPLLAVASAGMSIMGASQAHQAQKVKEQVNRRSALAAQTDELRQINIQAAQEDTAAAEQKLQTDLEVMQQTSRAEVAGGESGVSLNNNAVIQDMERQGLVANTGVDRNLDTTMQGLQEERLGSKSRAQSRINSVSKPSSTATGLKIGQAVVGGMSDSTLFD
tara:strand:+ start:22 stop:516 length:495 start_codon:yes stop_codon:yes gene_type:complete